MRKVLLIVGLVTFFGAALSASSAFAERVERKAEITNVTGDVQFRKSGSEDWSAASVGQKLGSGDAVKTSEAGLATVTFDEGSVAEVSSNTEYAIQSLAKETESNRMETVTAVVKGSAKLDVTPLENGSIFEIQTPINFVSVKGTVLTVTVNADGSVSASSDSGAVGVTAEGTNAYSLTLDGGKEALAVVDPLSGNVTVTAVKGTFDIVGPDGKAITLAEGDSIVFSNGAATFIPNPNPLDGPGGALAFVEPASGG